TYRELFQKSGYDDLEITGIVVQWDSVTTVNAVMVEASGCPYTIGDIKKNGEANGADVSFGVNYFKGFGPAPPVECLCPEPNPIYGAGDVNGSCQFNGVDITYFV